MKFKIKINAEVKITIFNYNFIAYFLICFNKS